MSIDDGLGRALTFTHGGDGLELVTDGHGEVRFEQDADGRLVSATDAGGHQTSYRYVDIGAREALLTSLGRPEGNEPVEQTYDAQGRVVEQTDAEGNRSRIAYEEPTEQDDRTQDTVVTFPDDSRRRFVHEQGRMCTSITDRLGATTTMDYDERTRMVGLTDRLSGTLAVSFHEPTGHIATFTDPVGATTTYSYTAQAREFSSVEDPNEKVAFTLHNLSRIGYPDGTDEQFEYDSLGRLAAITNRRGSRYEFGYDGRGYLSSATDPHGDEWRLTRDAEGVARQFTAPFDRTIDIDADAVGRTTVVADPLTHILDETSSATVARQAYTVAASGEPLAVTRSLPLDRAPPSSASTAQRFGAAGEVADAYAYDPYGLPTGQTGSSDQPFRYMGAHGVRWEPAGGIYEMGARYYDPTTAGFLSRDLVWPNTLEPRALSPWRPAHIPGEPTTVFCGAAGCTPTRRKCARISWVAQRV